MSEAPDKSKFSLSYLIKGEGAKDWYKALGNGWRIGVIIILVLLLLFGVMQIWNFFFPKSTSNIHKPTAIALPLSRIEKIDQSSVQVALDEKAWEAGVSGGGLTYDNKVGMFAGGWVRRRW